MRAEPPSSGELAIAWKPYAAFCIGLFGPSRCMFQSNFPVDKAVCGYAVVWNAFKKMASGHGEAARDDLIRDTAARFCGI